MYDAEQVVLIGMGGFGTQVADSIYAKVPESVKPNVVVHGFDTDKNDISKKSNLFGRITQTSADLSVGQYLQHLKKQNRLEETLKWFPEHPILRNKSMTNGAGQVRAVSRLAYLSAIEAGKMKELEESIRELKRNSSSTLASTMRVFLIASLAGGTGSGMFLQTALYLREYILTELKTEPIIIGAFLLPETLIGTGVLPSATEFPNIRCNAYSSVKELNAIMQTALFPEKGSSDFLELQYRPGQYDMHGNPDISINSQRYPFNSVFLFDSQNSKGEVLTDFSAYMNQVIEAVYQSTFTQFAPQLNSETDNFVQTAIKHHGRNLYCSAGVGRLVYPYDDIISYLTYRWTESSISNEWLKVDQLCEEEYLETKKARLIGREIPLPKLNESFVNHFDSLTNPKTGGTDYKFKLIRKSLFQEHEDGSLGAPYYQSFMKSVEKYIDEYIDQKLSKYDEDINTSELFRKDLDSDSFVGVVKQFDDAVGEKWDAAEDFPIRNSNYLVNRILMRDIEQPNMREGQPYQLNTWIFSQSGENCLHPVAVRYFLYKTISLLENALDEVKNEKIDKDILEQNFYERWDNPKTDEIEDESRLANLKQNRLTFMLKKKSFLKDYSSRIEKIVADIDLYVRMNLKDSVYKELLDHLRYYSKQWESFFDQFEHIKKDVSDTTFEYLHQHEAKHNRDETVQYVCAEPYHKNQLWTEIEKQTDAREEMPNQLFISIYRGMYQEFISTQQQNTLHKRFLDADQLFKENAIKYYREQLHSNAQIDMDIITALKKDCEIRSSNIDSKEAEKNSVEAMMQRRIDMIDNITSEWMYTPGLQLSNAKKFDHWGYHPAVEENIGNFKPIGALEPDDGFSKYELVKLRGIFGIKIEDVPQFQAGTQGNPGVYFQAYNNRVRQLIAEQKRETTKRTVLTPHIDKRWHLPGFMNDPNPEINRKNQFDILRAFVYGLSYNDLLYLDERDGKASWYYRQQRIEDQDGWPVRSMRSLFYSLFYSPHIVQEILHEVEQRKKQDVLDYGQDIEQHELVSGIRKNASFDRIMRLLYEDLSDDILSEDLPQLPAMFLSILTSYIQEVQEVPAETAKKMVSEKMLPELKSGSEAYKDIAAVKQHRIIVDELIQKWIERRQ